MASSTPTNTQVRIPSRLPEVISHITTHDETTGKSIIRSSLPVELKPTDPANPETFVGVPFSTSQFPANLNNEADVKQHEEAAKQGFDIVTPNGSNIRIIDFAPGNTVIMHRTISLDYGVVTEGTIELLLDGGEEETRAIKRGDIFVQRGTYHGWKNPSATEWARVVFVILDADKLTVAGKELQFQWG